MNRALFLDRDGVININHGYVHTSEKFDFLDGIFEICRTAREKGYLLIVVTNQAGIGRGFYSEQTFHKLTDWMKQQFSSHGAEISSVYFCPDHPVHGVGQYKRESIYRKPGPGMILAAANEFNIDLSRSVLVGDNDSDIIAGQAAGVANNILLAIDGKPCKIKKHIAHLYQLEYWL